MTDRAWVRIEPLLPPVVGRGRRWRDHRQVINAILWKLRTGAPWRDMPERYGPWKTAHERLRIWTADGTWERILDEVQSIYLSDPMPWIVGYSGGKDSTACLQLIWTAISRLPT